MTTTDNHQYAQSQPRQSRTDSTRSERKWRRRGGLLAALASLTTFAAAPGGGGPVSATGPDNSGVVRDWNLHAVDALINAPTAATPGVGQPPQVSALHLAIVHGAVYDAVNSIDGRHQPYLAGLAPAPPGASPEAAVATAAHHVLIGLGNGPMPAWPQVVRDRLDALYADALAAIPDGAAETDGVAAGAAAAEAMLAARAADGRYVPFSFTAGTEAGQWRPAPPALGSDPFAWVANVQPFVLQIPSQFRTRGPLDLRSRAYAKEYNEVKELGGPDTPDSPRNDRQNALARFYNVHPVELFNRTFRVIAEQRGLSIAEEARLFASINMAGADGLINCWSDKAFFNFWRPITAIHEGDNDDNRRTDGDRGWTSFLPTPPYPDHPSGYNCVTAAMMHTAEDFFGRNKMTFSVVRIVPNQPDVTRV
ncbi:MAG TPA: vanadium-dependent haloperoxidase, partial [Ilumatobacteraceae bacterium]|nr:vanadium-dependent haloperoxidase [Ilumatobacteraceae bacterium]